jgi:hypothetical protein
MPKRLDKRIAKGLVERQLFDCIEELNLLCDRAKDVRLGTGIDPAYAVLVVRAEDAIKLIQDWIRSYTDGTLALPVVDDTALAQRQREQRIEAALRACMDDMEDMTHRITYQMAVTALCGTCGGTGMVDSGGQDQSGKWIDVPCPECKQ